MSLNLLRPRHRPADPPPSDRLESLPPPTGLRVVAVVSVVATLLSLVSLPTYADVLLVLVATTGLVVGAVLHRAVPHAWAARGRRQRDWLDSLAQDLPELRDQVEDRAELLEDHRRDWARRLRTLVAMMVAAILVAYSSVLAVEPGWLSNGLLWLWVGVTFGLAIAYAGGTVRAAVRDGRD